VDQELNISDTMLNTTSKSLLLSSPRNLGTVPPHSSGNPGRGGQITPSSSVRESLLLGQDPISVSSKTSTHNKHGVCLFRKD
jgi:hypothetical protein